MLAIRHKHFCCGNIIELKRFIKGCFHFSIDNFLPCFLPYPVLSRGVANVVICCCLGRRHFLFSLMISFRCTMRNRLVFVAVNKCSFIVYSMLHHGFIFSLKRWYCFKFRFKKFFFNKKNKKKNSLETVCFCYSKNNLIFFP